VRIARIVLQLSEVNLMKRTMSVGELARWCKLILKGVEEVQGG
jgi:hypothetical protein